ncbi:probable cytochrome P450 12b2, mitochondrial isoform X1 [Vespa mandarinia]|uniref:probable cytochrome P450 12b2, mitochondrial isoform X1 n=2 Tax=Vespa mandarinia TaxID=7446 RepID=UPI0016226250|nr:probable cytochrome P450 12b2, mitochondrial isoform X1 [Vespa mandarinia]
MQIYMHTMSVRLNFYNYNKMSVINGLMKRCIKTVPYSIETNDNITTVRSYDDIPGPKPIWLIGNTFRFIPFIGEFGNKAFVTQLKMLRDQYGDIVKIDGLPNKRKTIFIFSSTLIEKVYRTEGPWPQRIAMESLHYYRINREWIYKGKYGLTTSQGKDWYDFRTKVNQHMMQPRVINPHIGQMTEIAIEFIQKIRGELRNPITLELPTSFNNEMNKWALESICAIALNHRLGCLKSNIAEDSEPQKMIDSIHDMFNLMFRLELMPSLWRIYNTRTLKKFFNVLDILNGIAIKYITQAKEKLHNKTTSNTRERSVLDKLLFIDEQIAYVMALDMLTAGVDTTSNTCGMLLYHLAMNPRAQEKLHNEIKLALPDKESPITVETMKKIPYLKACLKESLRLSPIAIGTLRTIRDDIVIGGYNIPKDCDIILGHSLLAIDPKEFKNPGEFIPERWIRGETEFPSAKNAHPFSYMPFGFGARTCIGRRFAEFEIEILVLKLLQNFRIEWHHSPLKLHNRLINTIASPLQFKLIDL